ncbi:MAG TPA: diaminopropionate ammonia-lyase [Bordetella sp.]
MPPVIPIDFHANPRHAAAEPYGAARQAILGAAALARAQAAVTQWPGYAPTALRALPALARNAGVAAIHYKDEGGRFGLGSFKALGGAYAVGRQLCRVLSDKLGRDVSMDELPGDAALRAACAAVTVTCATDGNHGRSVAWGARMFGCACVIYVHATVSPGRAAAIEQFGARVVRTAGNYDDAVRQADRDARAQSWFVISDTSYPGYTDVPRDVMQGYQLMVDEAARQIPQWPTHIFVQAGVGGFAAAVCGYFWERATPRQPAPRFIVVEPDRADCLMRSARAGRITAVAGGLDTLMAGLACGEVSLLAWDILDHGADAFCTVGDESAVALMRLLAQPLEDDPAIVAGESAVAGLAGALGALRHPAAREALGLGPASRLLCFGSEADTDPVLYRQLVGA